MVVHDYSLRIIAQFLTANISNLFSAAINGINSTFPVIEKNVSCVDFFYLIKNFNINTHIGTYVDGHKLIIRLT